MFYMSDSVETARMDKTAFSVFDLGAEPNDSGFWLQKSPLERLEALELMRAIHYGYDATTARLQRVLEVAELGEG